MFVYSTEVLKSIDNKGQPQMECASVPIKSQTQCTFRVLIVPPAQKNLNAYKFMPRQKETKRTPSQTTWCKREYRTISNAIAISCCTPEDWIFYCNFYFFAQQIFAYVVGAGQSSGPDKIKFRFYSPRVRNGPCHNKSVA